MAHRWISILGCATLIGPLAIPSLGAAQSPVPMDRQTLEQIIHDYLIAHP